MQLASELHHGSGNDKVMNRIAADWFRKLEGRMTSLRGGGPGREPDESRQVLGGGPGTQAQSSLSCYGSIAGFDSLTGQMVRTRQSGTEGCTQRG